MSTDVKRCPGCHETKPVDEFNWKIKSRNLRQWLCRPCYRAHKKARYRSDPASHQQRTSQDRRRRYQENVSNILTYFKTHPCVDCGESDPPALDFDHVRGVKRENISRMLWKNEWARVWEEIQKCDVRCANCHRRRTAEQFGWYSGLLPLNLDDAAG
jgi:hypothetical protein